jgi:hypothetical protein
VTRGRGGKGCGCEDDDKEVEKVEVDKKDKGEGRMRETSRGRMKKSRAACQLLHAFKHKPGEDRSEHCYAVERLVVFPAVCCSRPVE